jgi:hypothetical protein
MVVVALDRSSGRWTLERWTTRSIGCGSLRRPQGGWPATLAKPARFDVARHVGEAQPMRDELTESPRADERLAEPRGPHLPDVFARIPGIAWIFVAVAVARIWILIDTARLGPAPDPLLVANVVTDAIGSLAALLLPAALLIRHPHAPRRAPMLTVGVVLIAVVEVLEALERGLLPLVVSIGGDAELAPTLGPPFLAYTLGVQLVAPVGLAAIGLGLARTRRHQSQGGIGWTVMIVLFSALLVANRLAEAAQYLALGSNTIGGPPYVGSVVIIGILTILAWAYLTHTAVHGARAHEEPTIGWKLGAVAGGLALVSYQVYSLLTLFVLPGADLTVLLFLASGLFGAGPLALLLAFAAGLPSLESASEVPAD